jgi:PBP1b-binding outer membrane lipoprotein LpoB
MKKAFIILVTILFISGCTMKEKPQLSNVHITITDTAENTIFDDIVFGGMVKMDFRFSPGKIQVLDIRGKTVFAVIGQDVGRYRIIKRVVTGENK